MHPHALATLGRRHHGMDNIRAILSAAVVVHHSGMPYGTSGPWFLSTEEQLSWLGGVYALNEMVTVPFFFVLAGFQSYRSVYICGSARFARKRLSRLGAPYVVLLGAINPSLYYMSATLCPRRPDLPFPDFVSFYLSNWIGLLPRRGWPQQLMVDT